MRTVIDTRGITRPGQIPYPLPPSAPMPLPTPRFPLPPTPAPTPIERQPTESAPVPSTTPEEARLKDRLAWTGIGLAGAGAGWLLFKSLAAATGVGLAVVAGGMLLRDYNSARMFEDMRSR